MKFSCFLVCFLYRGDFPTRFPLSLQKEKKKKAVPKFLKNLVKKHYQIDVKKVESFFGLKNIYFSPHDRYEQFLSSTELEDGGYYIVHGDVDQKETILSNINSLRTGICYDERMNQHRYVPASVKDYKCPEKPERIDRILKYLRDDDFENIFPECVKIPSRMATKEELLLCHSEKYIDSILYEEESEEKEEEESEKKKKKKNYYFEYPQETSLCCCLSCGCVLEMIDSILTNQVDNGFVVCRPPGHHALRSEPMGFCIFGNAAIAAKYAIQKYNLQKVLVIDWDVHHGNGTQDLLEHEKEVQFISIHEDLFPNTGDREYTGPKSNAGHVMNILFDKPFGDVELLNAFNQLVVPVSIEYQPELILISCGFDMVRGDPLGKCKVHPETFGILTQLMMNIHHGKRLCLVLEGGYNLEQIPKCAYECLRVLQAKGRPTKNPPNLKNNKLKSISKEGMNNILQSKIIHSKFWDCLKPYDQMNQIKQKTEELEHKIKQQKDKIEELQQQLEDQNEISSTPPPPPLL